MSIICPTVTATNEDIFKQQLNLAESFASRLHVDFMDGEFAPTKSPNLDVISLRDDVIYDLHLMYSNPTDFIDKLIKLKPALVIIHAEIAEDIPLFATKMRQNGIKTGIAILPETTVENVKYILPHIQHVLVFGGHLGYHGGVADLSQLYKATDLKTANHHLELAWDGGANKDNIRQIADAGFDVINIGGAIQNTAQPKESYLQLQSLLD